MLPLLALIIILSPEPVSAATADPTTPETTTAETTATETMHLLCQGRGNVRISRTFRRQFIDSVRLEVQEAGGRILMPRDLWWVLSGGKDGWFNLEKLVQTEIGINAQVDAGLFDHARVSIDRISGKILIQSMDATYVGTCKRYLPDALDRKF